MSYIRPSVEAEKTVTDGRTSVNYEFVEKVSDLYLFRSVKDILKDSQVLREMIENGEMGIIPAKYAISKAVMSCFIMNRGFLMKKLITMSECIVDPEMLSIPELTRLLDGAVAPRPIALVK